MSHIYLKKIKNTIVLAFIMTLIFCSNVFNFVFDPVFDPVFGQAITYVYAADVSEASQVSAVCEVEEVNTLQQLKDKLYCKMLNRESTIDIKYKGSCNNIDEDINNVLNSIFDEDDYLKCSMLSWSWNVWGYEGNVDIKFNFDYVASKEQEAYVTSQVYTIVNQLVNVNMSDFEKEKAVHDYIVSHVAYDVSYVEHSDYAALAKGTTVCQGYALLAYKMLKVVGIENKIVIGSAAGGNHAWNMVYIDGSWYHLDCTWDDPIPDTIGNISNYEYYNLKDKQIQRDHEWDENKYPKADRDFIKDEEYKNIPDIEAVKLNADAGYVEVMTENVRSGSRLIIKLVDENGKEISVQNGIVLNDYNDLVVCDRYACINYSLASFIKDGNYKLKVALEDNENIFELTKVFSVNFSGDGSGSGSDDGNDGQAYDWKKIMTQKPWKKDFGEYKEMKALMQVPTDKKFTIKFNKSINKNTVTADSICLIDAVTGRALPLNFEFIDESSSSFSNYSSYCNKVRAVPKEKLIAGRVYYLVVKDKSVKSQEEKALEGGVVCPIVVGTRL